MANCATYSAISSLGISRTQVSEHLHLAVRRSHYGLADGAKLLDERLRNQTAFLDGNSKGDHAAFLGELPGQ